MVKKTEGRFAGGPLFLEASTCSTCRRRPTLGLPAAEVKAESGAKRARFPQEMDVLPFPDPKRQKAAVLEGRRLKFEQGGVENDRRTDQGTAACDPVPGKDHLANLLTIDE
jgi:hypothetical protein